MKKREKESLKKENKLLKKNLRKAIEELQIFWEEDRWPEKVFPHLNRWSLPLVRKRKK